MDAETLAVIINEAARAEQTDGVLLAKNLLKVAQHIDELIPEGSVLVDRARFERLRAAADHWQIECDYPDEPMDSGLEPGDLDPLP